MDYRPPPPPQARFSPIALSRTPTPMPPPPSILKNGEGVGGRGGRPPPSPHPKRQRSASFKNMLVDECDEVQTVATVPDNVSDTASEASSNGGYNNQPPVLDFMGTMCVASAWFTSCFPCAVVDINDTDDRVVHNLSRESAMNFMYANKNDSLFECINSRRSVTPECNAVSDGREVIIGSSAAVEQKSNSAFISQQRPEKARSESKILCIPSMIEEDDSSDDETMDVVALESDAAKMNMFGDYTHERLESGTTTHNRGKAAATTATSTTYSPSIQCSQPTKKKRFGMKNPFGRKKSIIS